MSSFYDCVVLAAGTSSRMGQWKMLLPWHGSTVLETTLNTARKVCRQIILVAGHREQELRAALGKMDKTIIATNPAFERGMFSSIQTGLAHVETEYAFITLGDMPLIPADIYGRLALETQASGQETAPDVLRPVCGERPGHPVLLSRAAMGLVAAAAPDSDMRTVLARFHTLFLPAPDERPCIDLDSSEQYRRYVER